MNDRTDTHETTRDVTADTTPQAATDVRETADSGFLPDDRMDAMRRNWSDVQASFVDDPRQAVEKAQNLVTQLVDELTKTFSSERSKLEQQSGSDPDTEALRVALRRYRSFFNRLLGGTPN